MKKKFLVKIVDNFSGKNIGVVGDLMLDRYLIGRVERISPEAPAPIVLINGERSLPGGAANTAANIADLGGNVFLAGSIGRDAAGDLLTDLLEKKHIDLSGVARDSELTTEKIRITASGHQMIRLDRESVFYNNRRSGERAVLNKIAARIKDLDALIVSDYAKGLITETLAVGIVALAKKHKKLLIVDTKPKHMLFFRGATCFAPNQKEAEEVYGKRFANKADIAAAAKILSKKLRSNLVITLGAAGMCVFENGKTFRLASEAKEVFDVTGAGDTVTAALALSLASGARLIAASRIANCAAGIVVSKVGTASPSLLELRQVLS